MARRVLEHGPVARDFVEGFREQVVVLGGLQRNVYARLQTEFSTPSAAAIDHEFRFDVAVVRFYPGDDAPLLEHAGDGDAFDDLRPLLPRALSERHGDVDRIDATVARHIEPGDQIVGLGEREKVGDFFRRNLMHVDTDMAIERGNPPVLFEAIFVGSNFDETDVAKASALTRFLLEVHVEVAGVLAKLSAGFRKRTKAHHESGRMPRRSRGEPFLFEQRDFATHVREVVGNRRADDPATDDDRARALWNLNL